MKVYNLFGYQVEIDKEATKKWYDTFNGWGCDCAHCQNFLLLAKKRELPGAVLEILNDFGILPENLPMSVKSLRKKDKYYISSVTA